MALTPIPAIKERSLPQGNPLNLEHNATPRHLTSLNANVRPYINHGLSRAKHTIIVYFITLLLAATDTILLHA